jgi:hypothetical protein
MKPVGATSPEPGRIAAWPPWLAWAVLLLGAVLTLSTAVGPPRNPPPPSAGPGVHYTDRELYREITQKVAAGQDYYAAATATQRAHGYPVWPPWAVREPTAAWVLALLQNDNVRWAALLLLAAAAVVLMRDGAEQAPGPLWRRIAVTLLFGVGLAIVGVPTAPYLHENWATVFIALSLACWRPERWGPSVAFGLAACLFREIALPYMLVMAAFAMAGRRPAEVLGWGAALAVLGGALAVHFALAARQHLPSDGFSPGWMRFGGWPFAVLAARRNIVLAVLPAPLASLTLLASLLGLVSARSPWTDRIAGTAIAFLALFMALGRPDNYYWGMIIAPLLAMGLPFAPGALRDLARAAVGRKAAISSAE